MKCLLQADLGWPAFVARKLLLSDLAFDKSAVLSNQELSLASDSSTDLDFEPVLFD